MAHSPKQTIALMALAFAALQSCSYSIKISNKGGVPNPDPLNTEMGFYNRKEVKIIDTVVKLSLLQNGVMALPDCGPDGFHSVEYKITFGAMLRNTFSFGKRKSIKVKIVCIKPQN